MRASRNKQPSYEVSSELSCCPSVSFYWPKQFTGFNSVPWHGEISSSPFVERTTKLYGKMQGYGNREKIGKLSVICYKPYKVKGQALLQLRSFYV